MHGKVRYPSHFMQNRNWRLAPNYGSLWRSPTQFHCFQTIRCEYIPSFAWSITNGSARNSAFFVSSRLHLAWNLDTGHFASPRDAVKLLKGYHYAFFSSDYSVWFLKYILLIRKLRCNLCMESKHTKGILMRNLTYIASGFRDWLWNF